MPGVRRRAAAGVPADLDADRNRHRHGNGDRDADRDPHTETERGRLPDWISVRIDLLRRRGVLRYGMQRPRRALRPARRNVRQYGGAGSLALRTGPRTGRTGALYDRRLGAPAPSFAQLTTLRFANAAKR